MFATAGAVTAGKGGRGTLAKYGLELSTEENIVLGLKIRASQRADTSGGPLPVRTRQRSEGTLNIDVNLHTTNIIY